jgi:hypothetical protein
MSKSKRTRQRYAKEFRTQTSLDQFGFASAPKLNNSASRASESELSRHNTSPSIIPCTRKFSESSISVSEESNHGDSEPEEGGSDRESLPDEAEIDGAWEDEWEDELGKTMASAVEILSWDVLRQKIKEELKKKSKQLSLTRINQFMILSNFATL